MTIKLELAIKPTRNAIQFRKAESKTALATYIALEDRKAQAQAKNYMVWMRWALWWAIDSSERRQILEQCMPWQDVTDAYIDTLLRHAFDEGEMARIIVWAREHSL